MWREKHQESRLAMDSNMHANVRRDIVKMRDWEIPHYNSLKMMFTLNNN